MVAHRHHYVPKCYLNAFAVQKKHKKKPQLLMFDAVEGKCVRNAPDNVALEKDFNAIDLEGHPPDAFEQAMASVESEIGPALSRIVEAESLANEDDRASLLNLIGLLHIRNPRSRETRRAIHEAVAKRILDAALSSRATWDSQVKQAQAAGFIAKDADTDYETVKQSYKPEDYTVEVANEAQIATEMQAFDHALPSLFERKWVLVKAPEGSPGFVTGDHPVSLTWSEPPSGPGPLGLRTPGTNIFFPITPKLAVVGTFEGEEGEAQFTDDEVASANGQGASSDLGSRNFARMFATRRSMASSSLSDTRVMNIMGIQPLMAAIRA
jgi:Protein of unknown function (DUF4238)